MAAMPATSPHHHGSPSPSVLALGQWLCRTEAQLQLERHPKALEPGTWGALGEGGHSMAPSPSMASAVLGARRDCLTVVCSFTLEPTDCKRLCLAQCCGGRV